jgi:hypothetical protein
MAYVDAQRAEGYRDCTDQMTWSLVCRYAMVLPDTGSARPTHDYSPLSPNPAPTLPGENNLRIVSDWTAFDNTHKRWSRMEKQLKTPGQVGPGGPSKELAPENGQADKW